MSYPLPRRVLWLIPFGIVGAILIQATRSISPSNSPPPTSLTVFAASSLTQVVDALIEHYQQTSDVRVRVQYAGTSTLATQIEYGASADILMSANRQQVQRLFEFGFIVTEESHIFATNRLVLITSILLQTNSIPQSITDIASLDYVLVVGIPDVPIRTYTEELFAQLQTIDSEIVSQLRQQIVSEESNVRQIVTRIALGEGDAAFVYQTDITPDIAKNVRILSVHPSINPPVAYTITALIDASPAAHDFVQFVLSDAGQAILQQYGFCPPDAVPAPIAPLNPQDSLRLTPLVSGQVTCVP